MPFKDIEYRKEYERKRQKKVRENKKLKCECIRCMGEAISGKTLCKECAQYSYDIQKKCKEKDPKRYKKYWKNTSKYLRTEVIAHYGGKCACCKVEEDKFLTIDHVDGNGCMERKRKTGTSLYRWLRKNDFPEGFRVLCWNCNCAMAIHGQCPHGNLPPQATNHKGNPYREKWLDNFKNSYNVKE